MTSGSKPPITNRGVSQGNLKCNFPDNGIGGLVNDEQRLTAGVDWFTATAKKDDVGVKWYQSFLKYSDNARRTRGENSSDWRNRWYKGMTIDGLTWGYSQQLGYIVIASGATAQKVWLDLFPGNGGKVTRVDIAVTVELDEAKPDAATEAYLARPDVAQRKYAVIQNSLGGNTLYVGSRSSEQYGRLYDKGVEAKIAPPGEIWRYEVEFKKPKSDIFVNTLYERIAKGGLPETMLVSTVWLWFFDRGVNPLFRTSNAGVIKPSSEFVATTSDRQLRWLRTSVAPTLMKLADKGLLVEALDALQVDKLGYTQAEFGLNNGDVV